MFKLVTQTATLTNRKLSAVNVACVTSHILNDDRILILEKNSIFKCLLKAAYITNRYLSLHMYYCVDLW